MEAAIDASNYNEADLISIKTKLNLPYYTGSGEFERVYGSVNVNGVEYEYVKRRVQNDTLELLCLPDKAKTALLSATYELDNLTIGTPATHKKNTQVIKISFPDFFQELSYFTSAPATELSQQFLTFDRKALLPSHAWSSDRPPQSMQCFS